MAAVCKTMKQFACRCASTVAGTSSASICLIADTVILAVSVFLIRLLVV